MFFLFLCLFSMFKSKNSDASGRKRDHFCAATKRLRDDLGAATKRLREGAAKNYI